MVKTSIQYIKEAAKKLVDSKLQRLGGVKTQEIFQGVMRTVGLESVEEVYLFVAHFDLTCRDQTSNMDDLSSYFECSSLDMIEYIPALQSLERKGLIVRRKQKVDNIFKQDFAVSDSVISAIIANQKVDIRTTPVKTEEVLIDKYEFCKRVAEKVEDREVVTEELILAVEKLENRYAGLPLVGQVKRYADDILDRILFYDICYDNANKDGEGRSDLNLTLKDMITTMAPRIRLRKRLSNGEQVWMKSGLIEADEDWESLYLTEKGKEFFYGEDLTAFDKCYKCEDIYTFIAKVSDSFHGCSDYDSDKSPHRCEELMHRILHKLENANKHLPTVERVRNKIPHEFDRALFYTTGKDMLENTTTSLAFEVNALYPCWMRKNVLTDFKNNTHGLQKLDLMEIEKQSSMFGEHINISITDHGKELLLGEDAALFMDQAVSDKLLLACSDIVEKELFFSDELNGQLSLVGNCLKEDYYQNLCVRLRENKLPGGIAVLLYGEPGTGKTESVMQLAKASGRAIMHVDISATKTCWFGESEKLIKKVFTDYRHLCKKCKVKPILLFNEADAVFSKRKDVNSGSVAQTENAIQNILLEEMESLDGILIATTNLSENLDAAFERRFLFKIRFDKPTTEAKKNIWLHKLPHLLPQEAERLAANYDFSGGQIDNVARKALMNEVIYGTKSNLESLIKMCSEERIATRKMNRIGFQ